MVTMNKQRPSGTPDDVRGTMEDLAPNRDEHEYHSGAWFRELTVKLAMCEDLTVSAVTSDDGRFMTWRWPWFLRARKNPDLPGQPTWGTQVLQPLVGAGNHSPGITLGCRAQCQPGRLLRRTTDIRVIISAYRIEKSSDDHPYILRYTPRGLGRSSITRIMPTRRGTNRPGHHERLRTEQPVRCCPASA